MKGMIFVELADYIEAEVGLELADKILSMPQLSTGGAYTSVGTYDVGEAVAIVTKLSDETGLEVSSLLKGFGQHLFGRLASRHPEFVSDVASPIDLLHQIERHIHVEVRVLYPDAELPGFQYEAVGEREIVMVYRSNRGLSDLCEGLIRGCFHHFGEEVEIMREALEGPPGTAERFRVRMQ